MQGLMTNSDRDSILHGLDEIERRIEAGEFVWRTDREDVHMNIEAALTDIIGEPAKKLHTARSRNDQVVTDLRLWCREAIDKILACIKQLQVPSELLYCSHTSELYSRVIFLPRRRNTITTKYLFLEKSPPPCYLSFRAFLFSFCWLICQCVVVMISRQII